MRSKNWRWVRLVLIAVSMVCGEQNNSTQINIDNLNTKDSRQIFSPRMDYDQWKPLGRGDPLKNDPTYDYVPPVLDRVHYWIDPALRKPDPPATPGEAQKTEILLLGVSSKKPSTGTSAIADSRKDTYDTFLKFVDGPKFNVHQRVARPHYSIPAGYFPTQFYTKKKAGDQRVPYTMLMPPPMVTKKVPSTLTPLKTTPTPMMVDIVNTTTVATVTPSVTIQASNLIYQSSSLSDASEWGSTSSEINWTPNPLTYTTNVKPFKEEVVFQKHLQPPESYIQIQFSPARPLNLTNKQLVAANSDQTINYVTPPPLIKTESEEVMHRGQVSDDDLDVSNTYVKIGKTEAQMHSTGPEMLVRHPVMIFSHVKHPMLNEIIGQQTPITMQTLQSMQTMQPPPPITTSPVYQKKTTTATATNPILLALTGEKNVETTTIVDYTTTTTTTTTTTRTTTDTPTTITTSLTTDPLFKHYKQPVEPLRGPLYLIIQGHSKVKTYGPSKQVHGIPVQETNEIGGENDDDDDEFGGVDHLHYRRQDDKNKEKGRTGRAGSDLQTLKHVLETGLGKIEEAGEDADRRQDFGEAEVEVGYKVAATGATSEKYHKGIVEEARKLRFTVQPDN